MKLEANEALVDAAFRGDLPGVEAVLAKGASPDAFGHLENVMHRRQWRDVLYDAEVTPLVAATLCRKTNFAIMQRLIDVGADIDGPKASEASHPSWRDPNDNPLWFAIISGAHEHARFLLDRGAYPWRYGSAILTQVESRRLLNRLLSMNPPQEHLNAALWIGGIRSRKRVPKLVRAGADPNHCNGYYSPLHTVGCPHAVRALVRCGADLEARKEGWTPLGHQAHRMNSSIDAIRALIDMGADVHAKGPHGETILMRSVRGGELYAETIEALLEAGADPLCTWEGANCLHCISYSGGPEREAEKVVHRLARAGTPVNAVAHDGITPLLLALIIKRWDVARALIQSGADPNLALKRDDASSFAQGTTPLMLAIKEPNIVRLLLKAGGVPTVQNSQGRTAADIAREELAYLNAPGPLVHPSHDPTIESQVLREHYMDREITFPQIAEGREEEKRKVSRSITLLSGSTREAVP